MLNGSGSILEITNFLWNEKGVILLINIVELTLTTVLKNLKSTDFVNLQSEKMCSFLVFRQTQAMSDSHNEIPRQKCHIQNT